MCPQIAWIHPNLYKTKALTQILVWLCSRVYETQEAHGPNSLHNKYSYQYKMLLILREKNPYLLNNNWKLEFPWPKDDLC